MNKNKLLKNLIIISISSALCFVGASFIQVPLGALGKVHLGNFICLLTSILFGPVIGGLSGSIGMTLSDFIFYPNPASILRTLILKFLMGFITGLLYKKGKLNSFVAILIPFIIFSIIGIPLLILVIINNGTYVITLFDKTITFTYVLPIISIILALIFFILLFFVRNKDTKLQKVIVAVSYATLFNIIMEFILRTFLGAIFIQPLEGSFIEAVTKIPSSIITGIVTIIFTPLLFIPLDAALSNKINNHSL